MNAIELSAHAQPKPPEEIVLWRIDAETDDHPQTGSQTRFAETAENAEAIRAHLEDCGYCADAYQLTEEHVAELAHTLVRGYWPNRPTEAIETLAIRQLSRLTSRQPV